MSQQFLSQVNELWTTIASPETRKVYTDVVTLSWQILQRLGQTIWLGICLLLVAIDSIGSSAIATGRKSRTWLTTLQAGDSEPLATVTSQRLLSVGQTGLSQLVANARKNLGLADRPSMLSLLLTKPSEEASIPAEAGITADPETEAKD